MLKTTDFTVTELKNYYFNDETMFFTSNAVQQLFYSQAQNQYYFLKIARVNKFCPRGRYYAYTPQAAQQYMTSYAI